jgi:hypothetical protein
MSPLETLLDQVRAALVGGDLAALAGLEDAMLAAADTVSLLDPQAIRRVKRKAERNAQLLQAANRGLRAARTRMAEIATGPRLSTYDSRGRKSSLAGPAAALGRF